jgi:hypothetical protein
VSAAIWNKHLHERNDVFSNDTGYERRDAETRTRRDMSLTPQASIVPTLSAFSNFKFRRFDEDEEVGMERRIFSTIAVELKLVIFKPNLYNIYVYVKYVNEYFKAGVFSAGTSRRCFEKRNHHFLPLPSHFHDSFHDSYKLATPTNLFNIPESKFIIDIFAW